MTEEVQFCIEETNESMQKAIDNSTNELSKIRAGKANPEMVRSVFVDYYGVSTPLHQVANINTPDAKNIIIQPWEKNMLEIIDKAIKAANLGLNPQNDGNILRITLPPLTEERRKEFVRNAKNTAEHGRIAIRNIRKGANDFIKSLKNDGLSEDELKEAEHKVQELTNNFISKIDSIVLKKEQEIMTI